jgi:hypothetical protein
MSLYSYGDLSVRESLWDQIKDLDALEMYYTTNAGKDEVYNKVHSWVIDPIASITTGAGTIELADTSYTATNPTLLSNTTQIIERGFKIAPTDQNSKHAGFEDRFAREQLKKMKEWKLNFELSAVAGTLVSGTGTAARTMQGAFRFASTLVTGQSGVSLTSDILNTALATAWGQGMEHDTVLVGSTLKGRISSFTTANTRNIAASDATIVGRVDVYDSDFGRVKIVLHRFINNLAANTYNVLGTYIQDFQYVGFLDEPHVEERAITGYFKAAAVVGEATVRVANEKSIQLVRGLL